MEKKIEDFKLGDEVLTPSGDGLIWCIALDTIHVKHPYFKDGRDYLFSKYHLKPTHHTQKSIQVLSINPHLK